MPTKRILYIENNEDTGELLTTILGVSDLKGVNVLDVSKARQMMKSEQFSLYIIDGQMPGISGLSLCERIREIDKVTPIVIFSGAAYQSDIDAGMLVGANAYVVKPNSSALVATIKRLLEGARYASP